MKLYIGIDWSQNKHDICFFNPSGVVQLHFVIEHTQTGFWKLEHRRQQMGVALEDCLIGLETSHSILIDFLWDRGYSNIYVLPPTLVKGSRTRFRSSGARDDPGDAHLIADIMRTDQGRLRAWKPDSGLTRQLRTKVKFIHFLTVNIVRMTNRQRAVLHRYYPAAIELFSSFNTLISQHFILEFPTPQSVLGLDLPTFCSFAKKHGYTHTHKLAGVLAKLDRSYAQADPEIIEACQHEAQGLAKLLLEMIQLKRTNLKELQGLLDQHPDRDIYASLPGTGVYLQAALISKLGDDRNRFSSADRVQHWQERVQLQSVAGNENRFASNVPVITIFVMLCSNGQNSPCVLPSGQMLIILKFVPKLIPRVMHSDVWAIGGWQCYGVCGKILCHTMRYIISINVH